MRTWTCTVFAAAAAALSLSGAGQKFYSDDPIWRDPETQNVAGIKPVDISQQYDFIENTFKNVGDRTDKRAVNINTVDQVPDSSWFTNRVGREAWTIDRYTRGPNTGSGPAQGEWRVIEVGDGQFSGLSQIPVHQLWARLTDVVRSTQDPA